MVTYFDEACDDGLLIMMDVLMRMWLEGCGGCGE
jgi:hypothetical protein